ncbi:MAG: hypothetical protein OEY15_06390 [Myxococcales bacterium]|nr:hypothetical protein [Myxococcales bacterium]
MYLRSRGFALASIALALFLGWKVLARGAHEVVVLRTETLQGQDHYATLWVVDAEKFVWIRAESPTRRWLPAVRKNPQVTLRRGGRDLRYRATIWDTPEARAYVDPMFRAKYGLADTARAILTQRETIPIRLEPQAR